MTTPRKSTRAEMYPDIEIESIPVGMRMLFEKGYDHEIFGKIRKIMADMEDDSEDIAAVTVAVIGMFVDVHFDDMRHRFMAEGRPPMTVETMAQFATYMGALSRFHYERDKLHGDSQWN